MTPQQIELALTRAQRICTLRGARLTPLRRRVFALILRSDQPTRAYALLAQLEQERGKLGPPTVYRALEALATSGDVRTLRLGTGPVLYECGTLGEHQHAVCQSCQAILHLEQELVRELEDHLEAMHRFRPVRTDVVVVGVCDSCARSGGRSRPRRRTLEHTHYD